MLTKLKPFVPYILIVVGIVLSIVSMLDICSDSCTEAHKYQFYEIDFGWVGIVVFSLLGVGRALRDRGRRVARLARVAYAWLLSCAFGAEVWLLLVQKVVIGHWCPICVSIAITFFLLSGFAIHGYLSSKESSMRVWWPSFLKWSVLTVVGCLLGFSLSFIGVGKPAEAQAATSMNLWIGKQNSPAEVYIITDWFCPGCRKAEPEIEATAKAAMGVAKVGFVDFAIHRETMNFSPYNLSFQTYEKGKYLQLRATLLRLAMKTKTPTAEEVQAEIAPLGVKYRQFSMEEVLSGMEAYNSVIKSSGVDSTPTVIVRDARTGRVVQRFVGYAKIKSADILAAVKSVGR